MSAVDDEADLFRRIRGEEAARFDRARGPVSQAEENENQKGLREFQERLAAGEWYGSDHEEEDA